MADRALSGLLLIVAALLGAFLFYRRLRSEGAAGPAPAAGIPSPAPAPSSAPVRRGGSPPVLPPVSKGDLKDVMQGWFPWPKKEFERIDRGIQSGRLKPVPGFYRPGELPSTRNKLGKVAP